MKIFIKGYSEKSKLRLSIDTFEDLERVKSIFNSFSGSPYSDLSKILKSSKLQKEIKDLTPMNRLGEYRDLFSIIDLLISDGSKFITGQNIFIDGGRTII